MHRKQRTYLAAQVWLTACLTLTAGVPRLTCVCPDGRLQTLLPNLWPGLSGCRCDDASANPSKTTPEKPCCRAKRLAEARRSSSHPRIEQTGCTRTLHPSAAAVLPAPSADPLPMVHLAATGPAALVVGPGLVHDPSDSADFHHAAPDDLTLLLRHLVI